MSIASESVGTSSILRNTQIECQGKSACDALRKTQKSRDNDEMSIGNEVRRRRKAQGLTLLELATRVDSDTGNLSRLERDKQGYSDELLKKIADALNCRVADLFSGDLEYVELEETPQLSPARPTPVVGLVQGGDDGFLIELDYPVGHGDGYLMHASKDANAYGLRVKGDSMRPRIKAGEYIICEPNREVMPGDDVVAKLRDGRRMVKELRYIRDGEVSLGSINNGHATITVNETEIEAIHYVAAIMPRGAFCKT